jgi:uncharacterized protein YfaS (alpha-2-macroglobulin family)
LITLERDQVYAVQWFKTDSTSSIQKIHVPENFQGNGYVNVAFVRDWNSPDVFINPLSYSVVPFHVNHEHHAIRIDLKTPKRSKPGEPFTINYRTDKPGKIIVFAVDEGILQVAGYTLPDPLAFFFQKRALEVLTQQTVDQILPQFIETRERSAVGGDGSEALFARYLNPFKRQTDLPVAFWSGMVDADTTSRSLVYDVPDYFNGTLHVMAVAVASDSVGSAEKTSEIRGPFVISPNTPTFVAPGDQFEISASVANNVKDSGTQASVHVALHVTPELEVMGAQETTLTIPEGEERLVRFRLKAKATLGSTKMTFEASTPQESSTMDATLSVRPATALFTSLQSGQSRESKQSVTLDRTLYPEYRDVEAVMSTSPLILISGLQRYLENFPYGCTEQLVSKAMPLLAISGQPEFTIDVDHIRKKLETTFQMLNQRQMSNGNFSYWPGLSNSDSNPFATVYAMHFLTEAKAQGYAVPPEMFSAGLGALKEMARIDVRSLDDARTQAYAIYVLTRNEVITTNEVTHLQAYLDKEQPDVWKHDLTGAYLAASYQLLKSYTEASQLMDQFKPQTITSAFDFYDRNIANAQYVYLIARHFPDRLSTIANVWVPRLVKAMNKDDINTLLSAYTSLALGSIPRDRTDVNPNFSIDAVLTDGRVKTLLNLMNSYGEAALDAQTRQVIFHNPHNLLYFYQVTQSGFDKTLPIVSSEKGLAVEREYRDDKGNAVDQVGLGNDVEVHIQVRSMQDFISNAVVVDLLPGGFEVVRDSVNPNEWDYVDVREDRVLFFGHLESSAKEIVYRIKAINPGNYTIPPVMAEAMYDANVRAHGVVGKMVVKPE